MIHPERYMPQHIAQFETTRLLGVAEAAFCCAMANADGGQRLNALNNTVICGGCSRIPGLQQRVLRELRGLLPSTMQISMLKCALVSLPVGIYKLFLCPWQQLLRRNLRRHSVALPPRELQHAFTRAP